MKKTIEYGLYLLVFLLPIQARWIIKAGEINGGYWEYGTYSLYAADVLLAVILILFVIYNFFSASGGKKNFKFIGCLLLFSAMAILPAENKLLAAYKSFWIMLGAGLFWVIAKAEYSRAKFFLSLFSGLALQAVLGIWQFLNQFSPANKWLGMASHQAVDLGASVVETIGSDGVGERWLRAYGGLDHPNMLGGIMAIGILMLFLNWIPACAGMTKEKAGMTKEKAGMTKEKAGMTKEKAGMTKEKAGMTKEKGAQDKKSPALKATTLLKGFVIIFSAALFFSFSRAAWLALAVGITAMLFGSFFKKDLAAQKNILQAALISGAVFFILFLQYQNLAVVRLGTGERLEAKSISEREESIKNSLPIIKNNFIIGAGLGNYGLALKNFKPYEESFYYQPAHNVFFLALSEVGIFGFIFFMALLFFAFIGAESFAVFTALIAIMLFDHWLWSLHFGVLFFWMVLGVIKKEKNKKLNPPYPLC
ncbi:MAG: O-antigen ligase family protein [bacterium]